MKLPSKEIKVDLYPTIDMNNPEEVREKYKHIVDPLHTELEREETSFINARRIFMHPLHIQPGLLSEKRLEQFKNVYPVSKSAINTTIQKYSIIEQQAKLMNNNMGLVNELGDYVELLNVYAPKHKARGEEVMKLLHNIGYKLDPKINATFYLYN